METSEEQQTDFPPAPQALDDPLLQRISHSGFESEGIMLEEGEVGEVVSG